VKVVTAWIDAELELSDGLDTAAEAESALSSGRAIRIFH